MNWDRIKAAGEKSQINALCSISRRSKKYRQWRAAVLHRDDGRCLLCNTTRRVQAHHLKRWIDEPLERFKAKNGITLCHNCHQKGHEHKGKEFTDEYTRRILNATIERLTDKISNTQGHEKDKLKGYRAHYRGLLKNISKREFIPRVLLRKKTEPVDVNTSAPAVNVRLT